MIRFICVVLALMSLLIGGCAALRTATIGHEPWVRQGGPGPSGDSESLLMYFEYVHKLPSAELAKEHDAVRQLYANSSSDFVRVRYAMLLSVPGAAFSDDARALEALDPLVRNADAALHNLAVMVSAQIQEQRRGQGLQQKLDALKSLEKNLIERDQGGAARRR